MVRVLLDHPRVVVNTTTPKTQETALHLACRAGFEEIALLLIGACPGQEPIHCCANHVPITDFLGRWNRAWCPH